MAPIPSWSYDVFLNFRGEDTRSMTFTKSLYKALCEKGINTFIDRYYTSSGIMGYRGDEGMKAIPESRTAIAIFSKDYASSTCCLDELVEIMECIKNKGRLVLPIFYHVEPCDVLSQRRSYAEVLAKHGRNNIIDKDKVKEWRLALQEVASLTGWHIEPQKGDENEFIQLIVQEISAKINHIESNDDEVQMCGETGIHPFATNTLELNPFVKEIGRDPSYVVNDPIGLEYQVEKTNSTGAYSKSEILSITENYRTIIGEGGFGKVYLGTLHDTRVAVKLLSSSSRQGHREFQSEVELLMSVHHRYLVSLIGYCDEDDVKALIYEYMDNGDLQNKLSDKNPNVLTWQERLRIAIDAAKGLNYLHNCCETPIIHRDLKPGNILLNVKMQAKIADFGLSRAFPNDDITHLTVTNAAFTPGYWDSRQENRISKKGDIYSFGVILLQLITGLPKPCKDVNGKMIHLGDWIIKKEQIQNIIDARLERTFSIASAKKTIDVARRCVSKNAAQRPDIFNVLTELGACLALDVAGEKGNFPNFFRCWIS